MNSVLWINGPFGVGKTHTACALQERLPGSFLFDPEEIGFTLRKLTPNFTGDFQDHPLWVPHVLDALLHAVTVSDGPVIVPMTLTHAQRHAHLLGGLRARGVTVQHFTLLAPPEVIHAHLRRRLEGPTSWAGAQVHARLRDLQADQFAAHLNTADRSIQQLAELIALRCGYSLNPISRRPFRWLSVTGRFRR